MVSRKSTEGLEGRREGLGRGGGGGGGERRRGEGGHELFVVEVYP